jgi:predicted enzyme related to lactoylglutathione lyase
MLALEVVQLPVTDVDRALAFYTEQVGFALDVDYRPTATFRVVQLTPPGSGCSVQLVTARTSGRLQGLYLVTTDIEAEHERLIGHGVAVTAFRHKDPVASWSGGWSEGLDPERRDYATFADFTDPDGNMWTLQERGYLAR